MGAKSTNKRVRARLACCLLIAASSLLSGCAGIGLVAAGVGGSTAVSHTLNGITYRTFTAPSAKVKTASYQALNRMGIKAAPATKTDNGELIRATANQRDIEIELEALSASTTRMRVIAKNGGLFYDSATATEIILQTEKLLGNA